VMIAIALRGAGRATTNARLRSRRESDAGRVSGPPLTHC
jgi:hypothetical protein